MTAWQNWEALSDEEKKDIVEKFPNIDHKNCLYMLSDTGWSYIPIGEDGDGLCC